MTQSVPSRVKFFHMIYETKGSPLNIFRIVQLSEKLLCNKSLRFGFVRFVSGRLSRIFLKQLSDSEIVCASFSLKRAPTKVVPDFLFSNTRLLGDHVE